MGMFDSFLDKELGGGNVEKNPFVYNTSGYDTAIAGAEKYAGEPTGLRKSTEYGLSAMDKMRQKELGQARKQGGGNISSAQGVLANQRIDDTAGAQAIGRFSAMGDQIRGEDIGQQSDRAYDATTRLLPAYESAKEQKLLGIELGEKSADVAEEAAKANRFSNMAGGIVGMFSAVKEKKAKEEGGGSGGTFDASGMNQGGPSRGLNYGGSFDMLNPRPAREMYT